MKSGASQEHRRPLTSRFYGTLLALYPAEFRQEYGDEMLLAFEALRAETQAQHGRVGLLSLWVHLLGDCLTSAWREHNSLWRDKMNIRRLILTVAGTAFLAYSAVFAIVNILVYSLDVRGLSDPFDPIINTANPTLISAALNGLIVLGPLLALGLFLLPLISVRLDWRGDQLVTIVLHKGSRWSLLMVALCLALGMLFVAYFAAENFSCLAGWGSGC